MVILPITMAERNLIEGHPRYISSKLFENRPDTFGKKIFKVSTITIKCKNALYPGGHVFFTNQHGLKGSESGSPKVHFYKNI